MTTLQKVLIATTLAAAIGVGTYEARQASLLRTEVKVLRQQLVPQPEPTQDAALASLQTKAEAIEAQNTQLASALIRANTDKARLETEREQARHAAALYKELVEQANSKELNPTNVYPTPRHVWAAFGKMGRLSALSKDDDSKLSAEEKSALDAAKMRALEEFPNLLKAAKQYDAAESSGAEAKEDARLDRLACLFYGALNLDEQQFGQVYSVMQKLQQEAKQKGLSKETPAPEAAEAVKQMMEQFKAETQTFLAPEQSSILSDVLTHIHLEPGKSSFSFVF